MADRHGTRPAGGRGQRGPSLWQGGGCAGGRAGPQKRARPEGCLAAV